MFHSEGENPKRFADLRGISLLDVMAKWYMTAVMIVFDSHKLSPWHRSVCYFGAEGLGANGVIGGLTRLMEKGTEWKHSEGEIHLFEGDIATAFDVLSPSVVNFAMSECGFDARMTAAILEEMKDLKAHAEIFGVPVKEPIVFNKCIRQGGVESPKVWRISMIAIMSSLVQLWKDMDGYGVMIDGRRYSHIIWADNVWLLGTSRCILQHMAQMLTDTLEYRGLAWKPSSLKYMVAGVKSPKTFHLETKQVVAAEPQRLACTMTTAGAANHGCEVASTHGQESDAKRKLGEDSGPAKKRRATLKPPPPVTSVYDCARVECRLQAEDPWPAETSGRADTVGVVRGAVQPVMDRVVAAGTSTGGTV